MCNSKKIIVMVNKKESVCGILDQTNNILRYDDFLPVFLLPNIAKVQSRQRPIWISEDRLILDAGIIP